MVPVSLTVFLNGLQWPLSAVSFSDCSAVSASTQLDATQEWDCGGPI